MVLLIEGASEAGAINYSFRAFSYDEKVRDIVTPGTGETADNDDGSLGEFPVQLLVEDGRGGQDIQDYVIKVWPDPENAAPVITSTAETRYALDREGYSYQIEAVDPDGDELNYRLLSGPLGALIDKDSGELLWFPENAVVPGDTVEFAVEVADGRGGVDEQTFSVEVFGSLGKIQGAVFDDLNGNGFRDSKLIKGDNPALILAIDVSGSTRAPFPGPDGIEFSTLR